MRAIVLTAMLAAWSAACLASCGRSGGAGANSADQAAAEKAADEASQVTALPGGNAADPNPRGPTPGSLAANVAAGNAAPAAQ